MWHGVLLKQDVQKDMITAVIVDGGIVEETKMLFGRQCRVSSFVVSEVIKRCFLAHRLNALVHPLMGRGGSDIDVDGESPDFGEPKKQAGSAFELKRQSSIHKVSEELDRDNRFFQHNGLTAEHPRFVVNPSK